MADAADNGLELCLANPISISLSSKSAETERRLGSRLVTCPIRITMKGRNLQNVDIEKNSE